jgi:hypothetical protein
VSVVVQMGIKIYCSATPPSSIPDPRFSTEDEGRLLHNAI